MICDTCNQPADCLCIVVIRLEGHGDGRQVAICEFCISNPPSWVEFHCIQCDGWHGAEISDCPLDPDYVAPVDLSPVEPL